jgi:hypothetical protein
MDKVKMIKKEAVIKIEIGTAFLQKIQKLFYYITANAGIEDIKRYEELAKNNQPFDEDWMEHLTTISSLLRELEENADKQGFIYEEDLQNVIPSADSLPDQFPEQPE